MKLKFFFFIFVISINSCAYKPLYKKSHVFHPNQVNIIIKSKENYGNNVSMMKAYLNQKLNKKEAKQSSLRLIVSVNRNISNLGINKDLNSYARSLQISIKYSFKDKKGELTSGKLKNSASFYYTNNNYANLQSLEDASNKLIKSLSYDLADLILAGSFERKVRP